MLQPGDPLAARRKELVNRLTHQLRLAEDANYVRTIKGKDGNRQMKVQAMWRTSGSGLVFVMRGVEFQPGKSAIALESKDQLPSLIQTLMSAIEAGELDAQIAPRETLSAPGKGRSK